MTFLPRFSLPSPNMGHQALKQINNNFQVIKDRFKYSEDKNVCIVCISAFFNSL